MNGTPRRREWGMPPCLPRVLSGTPQTPVDRIVASWVCSAWTWCFQIGDIETRKEPAAYPEPGLLQSGAF